MTRCVYTHANTNNSSSGTMLSSSPPPLPPPPPPPRPPTGFAEGINCWRKVNEISLYHLVMMSANYNNDALSSLSLSPERIVTHYQCYSISRQVNPPSPPPPPPPPPLLLPQYCRRNIRNWESSMLLPHHPALSSPSNWTRSHSLLKNPERKKHFELS